MTATLGTPSLGTAGLPVGCIPPELQALFSSGNVVDDLDPTDRLIRAACRAADARQQLVEVLFSGALDAGECGTAEGDARRNSKAIRAALGRVEQVDRELRVLEGANRALHTIALESVGAY